MSQPSEFDATALSSDENLARFAAGRQALLDCLAQTGEFPWLQDDGSAAYAAYQVLKRSLLARDPALSGSWLQWREDRNVAIDFAEDNLVYALERERASDPAAGAIIDQLVAELQARRDVKDFFSRLYDALGRSEFLAFRNRSSVKNSAIGSSLGELYDKVDKKTPLSIDAGKVLDVLGQIVAVVPGPGAQGVAAGLKATKVLYQVQAFLTWASDLIRSGNSLPWGKGSANAGTWGNTIATLDDIDAQQRAMFDNARTQLGTIKQCILYRWGRLDYLYTTMLQKQRISDELREYIANRIGAGWNYVMWQQLVWAMYKVRAEGPVVSKTFIHPDSYPVDFDEFRTGHHAVPDAKDRIGYVFKGEIADQDRGRRSPQSDGVVYAYYWKIRAGSDDEDIYRFFKYRLVSPDDKVPFSGAMLDYLRDSYGIERRHFVLGTHFDPESKTDMSLFGPAGRYFDPERNLKLDSGHTLKFSTQHRNAEYPEYSKKTGVSDSDDRADFALIESTQSSHYGAVTSGEFKDVHQCYRIRWVQSLGRIETVLWDADDGSINFFGDGSWVRWHNSAAEVVSEDRIKLKGAWSEETIGRTYTRPIDPGPQGNWRGVWTSGLQASVPIGAQQVLFFRMILDLDPERCRPELVVLQYDLRRKSAGKPRRVLDVWPDFPWALSGIDTALALFGKLYFFRGAQLVVYDLIDGIEHPGGTRVHGPAPIAEHFDASANSEWRWDEGCTAAWLHGAVIRFLRNDEQIWFPALPDRSVDARGLIRVKTLLTANASMDEFRNVMRIPVP